VPLYEYECDACGRRFEVIQKFSDPHVDVCTECGKGPVRRLFSSPAIQFKGSGFYITDYPQKGKSDSSSTTTTSNAGDTTKSDSSDSSTAKSDTKKTETTSTAPKSKDS
jgi:putative FmdB family regulatory protein